MGIENTVTVTVSVFDSQPTQVNFGEPLILGYDPNGPAGVTVNEYDATAAGLAAMVADGFSTVCDPYLQASAICAQNPHCDKFKVATRTTHNAQTVDLTPAYTTAGRHVAFELYYNGTWYDVDFVIQAGDAAADVCDDIVSNLGAVAGLTITDNSTKVTINQTSANGVRFYLRNVVGLVILDTSADAGIASTDLVAVAALDLDWYGLLIDSQGSADIAAAGAWALSNNKILGSNCADTLIVTSDGGVAADLYALTNHYAYVIPTRDMYGQASAGLMGRQFSQTPGSSTWAHKTISGATADAWTSSEFSYAQAAKGIIYANDQGISHTYDGWACSGRYLDITRGIDWLKARIKEAILATIVNAEKVPYTDQGAARLEAALRGVLSQAESNNLLAGGWSVTRPAVADVSSANKTARIFPDLHFSGVLTGAIHTVSIDGVVTP